MSTKLSETKGVKLKESTVKIIEAKKEGLVGRYPADMVNDGSILRAIIEYYAEYADVAFKKVNAIPKYKPNKYEK